jgi:glutamate formiminotransferase/formiminotetrahydrofolate cyclodeaminase
LKLVECVPNFSEGRRKEVVDAIVEEVRTRNVRILDIESDADHNRSVLTFVGSPEAILDAALAASAKAIELIDLNVHRGQHPRMGAVDVVPFIPLSEVAMEDCVQLAREFANQYSSRFKVPVFLYEEAATRPTRKNLADVRSGEFEGLREKIGRDEQYTPDFGPKVIHPTAGATAVGARKVLIAYNINLRTKDVQVAKKIAKQIRARDGGLACVKALGFELKDRDMVQVSMNMVDYKASQLFKVFSLVEAFADHFGVDVANSEIVGLVPMEALTDAAEFYLKLHEFNKNQILERRLYETESERLVDSSLASFADAVASDKPVPGGGSVSAYAGCLASCLISMVSRLTLTKTEFEDVWPDLRDILTRSETLRSRLLTLVDEDSRSYTRLMEAYRLPKTSEEERQSRSAEIQIRLKNAAEVPMTTAAAATEVLGLAVRLAGSSNINAVSDLETAISLGHSAALGALSNVSINLSGIKDEKYRLGMHERLGKVQQEIEEMRSKALGILASRRR